MIRSFEPYSFELDYLITFSAEGEVAQLTQEGEASPNVKTNKDYILDYIESMFETYKKQDEDIDLEYLKKKASMYYDNSLAKAEEED